MNLTLLSCPRRRSFASSRFLICNLRIGSNTQTVHRWINHYPPLICDLFSLVLQIMNSNRTCLATPGWSESWWVNLLGFQVAWWSCILYGDRAIPLVLVLLALHLLMHGSPRVELKIIIGCAILGLAVDAALTGLGVFVFAPGFFQPPLWLLALWLAFSATLRQLLHWFSGRYLVSAIAGSVGGSSSYLAAGYLGAVSFGVAQLHVTLMLGLVWMLLFPALMKLADTLGGRYVTS